MSNIDDYLAKAFSPCAKRCASLANATHDAGAPSTANHSLIRRAVARIEAGSLAESNELVDTLPR